MMPLLVLALAAVAVTGTGSAAQQPADRACPCGDGRWCKPLTTPKSSKEVYAFDPGTTLEVWHALDWSSITTIAFAGSAPRHLVCDAHRRGVRAVVLTGLMPEAANASTVARWISTQTAIVAANGTDGVNIDIEGYGTVETPVPRAKLTEMVGNLSAALRAQNPHAQISMDAVGYPANGYWWTGYDWPKLAEEVDFLVVMVYDLLNVDACSRGNCSLPPSYSRFAQSALPAHVETVKQYSSLGVLPSKLVLGVPWYGYSVPCASANRSLPCELPVPWPVDPIGPWPCKGQPDPWCCPQQVSYAKILQHKVHKKKSALLKYADICQDRLQTSARKHWSKRWCFSQAEASSGQWQFDAGSVTAYFDASNASGGRIQYWYDDPATLSVKATWMKSAGVRGVAMWTAGSVNYTAHEGRDAAEMWGALRLVL